MTTEQSVFLAEQAAELLTQDHQISDDPLNRAVQLVNLCLLTDAVQRMGWHAHTSNWDWSATIRLRDGDVLGAGDSEIYGDTFSVKGIDLEAGTACVDFLALTHFVVLYKENHYEAEPVELPIPVNIIQTIHIWFDT